MSPHLSWFLRAASLSGLSCRIQKNCLNTFLDVICLSTFLDKICLGTSMDFHLFYITPGKKVFKKELDYK